MIMYLSDVESGGDTLFPLGRGDCSATWRTHPKKGRAVLFFNHFPDGSVDRRAQHIGCPVNEGVKWIAQRWFRFEPYNRVSYHDTGKEWGNGWDARFDGQPLGPEDRAPGPHFRTVFHSQP